MSASPSSVTRQQPQSPGRRPPIRRVLGAHAARRLALVVLAFSFVLFLRLGQAHAERYLAAEPMAERKVRIDGLLQEWPGDFPRLQVTLQGKGTGGKAIVGYDDQFVYLAADLKDQTIARTKSAGKAEDHLSLEVFVPSRSGRGGSEHRIDVYPGLPGKLPAVVKVDGQVIEDAQAVEAPHASGLALEARVPWTSLGPVAQMKVGLLGRLVYYDASSPGRVSSVFATAKSKGSSMPPLTLEAETGLFQSLIEPKGLPSKPARHAFGDLTGKGGVQHVCIYGHFLSIAGPGYKDGRQFYVSELDVSSADRVRRLELRDLSGDGLDEIVIEKRLGPDDSYREVLFVLSLDKDGVPKPALGVELGIVTKEGSLRNEVTFQGAGKDAKIIVSQGKSKGFEPDSFREPTIGGGIVSALLPWESVKRRTFVWKGSRMEQLGEQASPQRAKSPGENSSRPAAASTTALAPPPPRPPTEAERLDRVYALYRKDRGVKQTRPRFDLATDVVEDAQSERVLVHDKDLVVFGKGFRQGLSYAFLTIGVEESKDILSVTTRDLVGDGKAEILVLVNLRTKASKQLGGDVVERQALFVYKVIGETLTRIFAAETARGVKGKRVLGSLSFVPTESGVEIRLDRLRAVGYSEKNYPFPEDAHPAGGLEPLLLPWGAVPARRYTFDGANYVLK